MTGVNDLTAETYETAHGGYDPTYANIDADRVLPVDVMRDLEKEGVIGELHRYYYSTVGMEHQLPMQRNLQKHLHRSL